MNDSGTSVSPAASDSQATSGSTLPFPRSELLLDLFSADYFHSYDFRLGLSALFENAVRKIQPEGFLDAKLEVMSMSVASSLLIRRMLIATTRHVVDKFSSEAVCDAASVYNFLWQLIAEPSFEPLNADWRWRYPWPLSDSIINENPRTLCQSFDVRIGRVSQRKYVNILPDPREIKREHQMGASSVSASHRSLDIAIVLVTFFELIVFELLECSTREQSRRPHSSMAECNPDYIVYLSVQDQTAERDDLDKTRTKSATAVSSSRTDSSKENLFQLVVLRLKKNSMFLYSYFLSFVIYFKHCELLFLICQLNMCEEFGILLNTPMNRYLRAHRRNDDHHEEGFSIRYGDARMLFSEWTRMSANPSINGQTLGPILSDSWRFRLNVSDSRSEIGSLESILCHALTGDETPIRNQLPEIEDLHSILHGVFEASGARQILQPAIEAMWWNDEKLLQQYAVNAVASGFYRHYSKIGGNSLFARALHVKPCQVFGRSKRSLLHGRNVSAEDALQDRVYQYLSFSLLDADELEYPFLAEIVLRQGLQDPVPERGLVFTYVKGEPSCLVGVMISTRSFNDDLCKLYLDVDRLRQAIPSFANYKPHGEFHRSFLRYWQAKSVALNIVPGCLHPVAGFRAFHSIMENDSRIRIPPPCLETASLSDLLEIEETGEHREWFHRTEFLKIGAFGGNSPPDPEKTFHDMIASAHLSPEQELQFELELAMCTAMRMVTSRYEFPPSHLLLSLADIQPIDARRRFAEQVRKEHVRIVREQGRLANRSAAFLDLEAVGVMSVDDLSSATPLIPDLARIVKEYLDPVPFLPFVPDEVERMSQPEWVSLLEPWWELPRLDQRNEMNHNSSSTMLDSE